jgi:polysaccharide biosynthesis protein PelA
MEVHEAIPFYKLISEEDYLVINGEKICNNEYKTNLVDLRSKRWTRLLIHYIGNLIQNHNYDGIFLDTIGDIEFNSIPSVHQDLLLGSAINMIRQIKDLFKDCIIIQNNGLDKVFTGTAKLIDGLCWENPPLDKKHCRTWTNTTINQLEYLNNKEDIKIFMLLEEIDASADPRTNKVYSEAERIAKDNNFILYSAPNRYIGDISLKK